MKNTAFLRRGGDDYGEAVENRWVYTLRVRDPSYPSGSPLRGLLAGVDRIRRTDEARAMGGVVNESGPGRRCETVGLLLLSP